MNLEDLYKLAGIQRSDTPAIEPKPVEQQVVEQPIDGREDMKAMIALVTPEQLNQLVGDAPVEEEGFANSGDEYAGEPEEFKGTLGSPADLSLRRYLGADGQPVKMENVYADHTLEDITEAWNAYKLTERPSDRSRRGTRPPDAIGKPTPMPPIIGEPIPEPREPKPPMPTPGGGPSEPPSMPGFDPDPDFPDEPEKPGIPDDPTTKLPQIPISTKIDPDDLEGDMPADPDTPDMGKDVFGRDKAELAKLDAMFKKYGLTPPKSALMQSAVNEEPNEGNEFTGALAKAKKDGKKEFKVDGKTYQVEEVEQLHADMNRMRKLSGLSESTIMERPSDRSRRGTRPPDAIGPKPTPPTSGTRPPDAIGPTPTPAPSIGEPVPQPTPPKEDPRFDPFGGAPGDEGEDPMGGMGEPSGPAVPTPTPPAPPTPKPTPPAVGTRPPDAIGPTPTDPKAPATPDDTAEKPKAPAITPGMRADAEAYADRVGLPLNQIGTLVPGTVGGIATTLEVGKDGTVTDMKTGDIIGGDDADAAREASKGRTSGLGKTPDAGTAAPSQPKKPTVDIASIKRMAKLAGYTDEQIAAYEKQARAAGIIK